MAFTCEEYMESRREEDRSSSPFCLSRCNCKKRSPVTNFGAIRILYSASNDNRDDDDEEEEEEKVEEEHDETREKSSPEGRKRARWPRVRWQRRIPCAFADAEDIFILSKALFSFSKRHFLHEQYTRARARARKATLASKETTRPCSRRKWLICCSAPLESTFECAFLLFFFFFFFSLNVLSFRRSL